jgi:hypothetical protein
MDQKLLDLEREILWLADNMASATAQFNSQNYELFLQSRENLEGALREMLTLFSSNKD